MAPNKTKTNRVLKTILGIVIIPLIVYLVMEMVCGFNGINLFHGGYNTFQLFLRGTTYILLLSLGVSINMHSGRFDFSTGATMLLAGVIGAKIAYENHLGPTMMVVIAALSGLLLGFITGFFYVLLKLPPMIIGLAAALLYEGVTAIITDGCKPVRFGTDSSYYAFAINPLALGIIIAIALVITIIVFNYTKFGYDYSALQTGQKISVNTGIKEKINAVGCYCISGFLFGIAGAISILTKNSVTPTYNFSSISAMFSCFLPLFFGDFISKYTNKQLGIFIGCMSYELIQIGFGHISFKQAGFSSEVQSVVEALVLVGFLIYMTNQYQIHEIVTLKKWLKKSKEKKETVEEAA